MAVTSAIVLLVVFWFMVFFIVLPLRLTTQQESGSVVEGTPGSAPANPQLKRKVRIVTAIALPLWAIACAIILSGAIPADYLSMYHRFGPERIAPGGGQAEGAR
ncbi:DUF1467 family protein [Tropicimonas sp.]|uniref:DUF1467 family protein n=1 Tax=Tropicimonas sp. TaxID=2067044 RepID=UPI003A84BD54